MRTFSGIDEIRAAQGEHLGHSDWHQVDQTRISLFADATGDHQWIHVDPERARQGPFGTTIAHGYLTLSLLPMLLSEVFRVENVAMGINYGANRVRFPAPVRSGSRVRCGAELTGVEDVPGGVQILLRATIEAEGQEKPVCVAETVSRFYSS